MKTVITIQHTQSVHHNNGMIGSWTDWDLTDHGVEQARRIGQGLASELGERELRMYTSDLIRARRTAELIAESLRVQPIVTQVLRERNMGPAVGKSKEWFQANMKPERTVYDRFFDGAESRKDVWDRLTPFLEDLIASDDDLALVVSHGDTLSVFTAMWLGMEPEDLNRCDLSFAAGNA